MAMGTQRRLQTSEGVKRKGNQKKKDRFRNVIETSYYGNRKECSIVIHALINFLEAKATPINCHNLSPINFISPLDGYHVTFALMAILYR